MLVMYREAILSNSDKVKIIAHKYAAEDIAWTRLPTAIPEQICEDELEIRLDQFSDLRMYEEWLLLNIEGVYKKLIDMSYFNLRTDTP